METEIQLLNFKTYLIKTIMKQLLFSFIFTILTLMDSNAQTPKFAFGLKSTASSSVFEVFIKALDAHTASNLSTINFTILVPQAGITTTPTLAFDPVGSATNSGSPSFNSFTWDVLNDFGAGIPHIETVSAVNYITWIVAGSTGNTNITSAINGEVKVGTLRFSGGVPGPPFTTSPRVAHLPNAGNTGISELNINITNPGISGNALNHNQRAFGITAGVDFQNISASPAVGGFYWSSVSGVTLPVKFASFFAYKQNNDGLLNWTVENQNAEVKHFEIERSFNGTSFTKIAQQDPAISTNGFASYNLTDVGVFDTYKGVVYYRIKQVDRNGVETYSTIRTLKTDSKAFAINLYPNPVIKNATIAFSVDKVQQVNIQLVDMQGKTITNYSIQAVKGINQKQIDVSTLANGTYTFIIKTSSETENLQFVKSN
jgi:hypothetical protein